MSVYIQGGLFDWPRLVNRGSVRPEISSLKLSNSIMISLFSRIPDNTAFITMESCLMRLQEDFKTFVDQEIQRIKTELTSRAHIMTGRTKYVALSLIQSNIRVHVLKVIEQNGGSLPSFKHSTDPVTGGYPINGVSIKEYYLDNAAGGRMTRRAENGKLSYYYSAGSHGLNQYYYTLITNARGLPVLRGYPDHMISTFK